MQRYNSFNIIHKGLRAALYQTALQLQQTDFTEGDQIEDAINKLREVVLLFEGHAYKEDHFVLPLINEYEPSVVATFNAEHQKDEELGVELESAVKKLSETTTSQEKIVAGSELTTSFVRFMVFNLAHMAKEEDIINQILWRYYSDDEIKAVVAKISQNTPPWMHDFYAKWMLRGISNGEAITWMKMVEKGQPPIVFQTLVQKAEQELPRKRFQKIRQSLKQEVAVA